MYQEYLKIFKIQILINSSFKKKLKKDFRLVNRRDYNI